MHPFRNEGGGSWRREDRDADESPRNRGDDPRGYGEGRYGQRGGPARDYGEGRYEGRQRHDSDVRESGYYGGGSSPAQRVWESSARRPPWEEDEAWRRGSEVRDEWGDSPGNASRGMPRGRERAGPKGYQRSDERIREDICERLAHARHVDVREVEVEVQGGVVRLTGNVRDRRQKYCIEDIVDDVFGVQEIHNAVRLGAPGAFGVAGITEGAQSGAQSGGPGPGHVSGVSSSGSATGSTASSYGGGMETGSGGPGQGRDSTGGTTRMG
ncbi:BON domain-containing protein [Cupriavidus taiwanensis]|uniref:BON domain-containing protein n=1 Tax=Cupriavidus taiwanensis TaxID=164546 RepID=UPI000E103E0C|nr:BON domain-containing protein [Cupriavidus taiwanensis]SOY72781.1 putative RNA-binding domain; G/S rich motif [Cupriavidus taiwanensis]SOY73020.1 putative RNA-binding domain; G/S rich motif [Cupriavidus taiwanensis]SOY97014.1 putative RNA-binding domain; G/S rich motif [Cupriavidus taiwanensis]SOZ66883.1 putative RNA-binding domain; G/S rich motif [Cupriavidus taiwanensis]SOZ84121.1 putative RNA-binding domain; G/S rich motif [Cupriavidus taiwanensis]